MSDDSSSDKTLEATAEKIKKAREKGDIPISTDLNVLMSYAGFLIGIVISGSMCVAVVQHLAGFYWHPDAVSTALITGSYRDGGLVSNPLQFIFFLIGPAATLVMLGLIVQQGIVFAPTKLKPDLKRIDPIQGFKKKFGSTGMTEFAKAAVKMSTVAVFGGLYLWSRREAYLNSTAEVIGAVPVMMRTEIMNVLGLAMGVALVVSLVDVPLKRFEHAKKLRMSRKEVSDENKEMEGDPTQKQARKRRAEGIANNKMLQDTASADVVVVNPTHYAVALKWDRGRDTVPVCVAKGVDHMALAIIDRARLSAVPLREDPPCARALHATVEIGAPIKPEHFFAVAAAIRFAESVRSSR